jgi:hypothetical protein
LFSLDFFLSFLSFFSSCVMPCFTLVCRNWCSYLWMSDMSVCTVIWACLWMSDMSVCTVIWACTHNFILSLSLSLADSLSPPSLAFFFLQLEGEMAVQSIDQHNADCDEDIESWASHIESWAHWVFWLTSEQSLASVISFTNPSSTSLPAHLFGQRASERARARGRDGELRVMIN